MGVPYRYDKDPKLGTWVNNQRTTYKQKRMTEEHSRLLSSIGFDWRIKRGPNNKKRSESFSSDDGAKNGDNSSSAETHNNSFQSSSNDCDDDNDGVDDIGCDSMTPRSQRSNWNEMYQRLVAYKTEHGDANVPYRYERDPKLGPWVSNQRTTYNQNKMTEERIRLFDSI